MSFQVTDTMVPTQCPTCGVWQAVPSKLYWLARDDALRWIYCPNGHQYHYLEPESPKLQRRIDALQADFDAQAARAHKAERLLYLARKRAKPKRRKP